MTHTDASEGRVTLVGGGPGSLDLLTLGAVRALESADVVLYDHLAPLGALTYCRDDAELVNVGKLPRGDFTPQETINAALVEHAQAGRHVVRFKGGDSFVFGRGGEEWLACTEAGVRVDIIPGISSSLAVPAAAEIPVTHRGLTQGFTVVSGHVPPGDPRSDVNWAALAQSNLTLVILMGVANLPAIADALRRHGMPDDTGVACVEKGYSPQQRVLRGTLATIPDIAQREHLTTPAITVVGGSVDALRPGQC